MAAAKTFMTSFFFLLIAGNVLPKAAAISEVASASGIADEVAAGATKSSVQSLMRRGTETVDPATVLTDVAEEPDQPQPTVEKEDTASGLMRSEPEMEEAVVAADGVPRWEAMALGADGSMSPALVDEEEDEVENKEEDEVENKEEDEVAAEKEALSSNVLGTENVPMKNNWRAYGHSFAGASYTVKGSFCIVDGLIKKRWGIITSWGHFATLPGSCRPPERLVFSMNNHGVQHRIDVAADGKMSFKAGTRQLVHSWISLSGIRFAVKAAGTHRLGLAMVQLGWGWAPYLGEYGWPVLTVNDGICVVQGLAKGSHWGGVATLPEECRPKRRLVFNLNNHAKGARVDVTTSGVVQWKTGGRDHGWLSLSGIIFAVGDTQEMSIPLHNGWVSYGGDYGSAVYSIKSGHCIVQGLVKGGTWGHIATLPSDCRPLKRVIFNGNNNQNQARVDVETNGKISWIAGSRGHGWLSLAGISFITSR